MTYNYLVLDISGHTIRNFGQFVKEEDAISYAKQWGGMVLEVKNTSFNEELS